MTYLATKINIYICLFIPKCIVLPCDNFDCETCHNFELSLTIIMNNEDQYLEKQFMSKNLHSATCQILINGWQSMTSTWHHGCNYNGVT